MERFDRQIENMYSILVNISSELVNIKGMMQANRRYFPVNEVAAGGSAGAPSSVTQAASYLTSGAGHQSTSANNYAQKKDEGTVLLPW